MIFPVSFLQQNRRFFIFNLELQKIQFTSFISRYKNIFYKYYGNILKSSTKFNFM